MHAHAIALVPVLSMFGAHPGSMERGDLAASIAAALAVATALVLLAGAAYRDIKKGALFASVLLAVFVAVGALYALIEYREIAGVRLGRRRYLVPMVYLAWAAFGVSLFRSRRNLATLTLFANIVTVGALLPPAIRIARTEITTRGEPNAGAILPAVLADAQARARPDIYYVVFDRYGNHETLRAFGIDNTPLFEHLESKGFFIARESRSNYINTFLSLSSSLNMVYLDDVAHLQDGDPQDWRPIHDLVRAHRVGAFLRSQGYQYIHMGTWHSATRDNPQATRNVNYHTAVPRATMELLDNPLFEPIQRLLPTPLIDHRRQHWDRIVRQVNDAVALAAEPGPKFVFLHLLVPHQPYVFNRDGTFVPREDENHRTRRQNYSNQVQAANGLIRKLVDGVLERSASPPVIIVQGDEGPYPDGTEHLDYKWSEASVRTLRERTGILNAYHLPGAHAARLYPDISPVNSFRVVFNTYLGTHLPLLPDRTMRHGSNREPFPFADVTDLLKPRRTEPIATTGASP